LKSPAYTAGFFIWEKVLHKKSEFNEARAIPLQVFSPLCRTKQVKEGVRAPVDRKGLCFMAAFTIRGKNVEVTPALRDYVEKHLVAIKAQIAQAHGDQQMALMAEYQKLIAQRNKLAKELGSNIIV